MITLTQIGIVSHYYDKIGVAIVKLEKEVKVGDTLHFGGEDGFKQEVTSMQMDHEVIATAKKGEEVGVKVDQKVKEGTPVHLA